MQPIDAFALYVTTNVLLMLGSPTILGTNVPPKPVMVRDIVRNISLSV